MGESIQKRFKKMFEEGGFKKGEFQEFINAMNRKIDIPDGHCKRCLRKIEGRRKGAEFCSKNCKNLFYSSGMPQKVSGEPDFRAFVNRIRYQFKNRLLLLDLDELTQSEYSLVHDWAWLTSHANPQNHPDFYKWLRWEEYGLECQPPFPDVPEESEQDFAFRMKKISYMFQLNVLVRIESPFASDDLACSEKNKRLLQEYDSLPYPPFPTSSDLFMEYFDSAKDNPKLLKILEEDMKDCDERWKEYELECEKVYLRDLVYQLSCITKTELNLEKQALEKITESQKSEKIPFEERKFLVFKEAARMLTSSEKKVSCQTSEIQKLRSRLNLINERGW